MNALTRRLTQLTIGIAALALTATANPALAGGKAASKIRATAVQGQVVSVNVVNPTLRPARGTVVTRLLSTRGISALIALLDFGGGQTGTVRTDLPATPLDVPPLGVVVDDGVPF